MKLINKITKIAAAGILIVCATLQISAQGSTKRDVVNPMQAGTLVLDNNDKATVSLSAEVQNELLQKDNVPSYYVVFTPVSQNINLAVTNKGDKAFSVIASDGKNSTKGVAVDYVVFVRETVSVPDPATAIKRNAAVIPAK